MNVLDGSVAHAAGGFDSEGNEEAVRGFLGECNLAPLVALPICCGGEVVKMRGLAKRDERVRGGVTYAEVEVALTSLGDCHQQVGPLIDGLSCHVMVA